MIYCGFKYLFTFGLASGKNLTKTIYHYNDANILNRIARIAGG
jgi:hypothetical protein